jgi:hypothetical protein
MVEHTLSEEGCNFSDVADPIEFASYGANWVLRGVSPSLATD